MSCCLQSSFTVSIHLFLGLPCLLVPSTYPWSASFGYLVWSILCTWPKYCIRRWCMRFATSWSRPILSHTSLFLILSLRVTPAILLKRTLTLILIVWPAPVKKPLLNIYSVLLPFCWNVEFTCRIHICMSSNRCSNNKTTLHWPCWVLVGRNSAINPLESNGNYSATSSNIKLVHWPLMGWRLHQIWYSPRIHQRPVGLCQSPYRIALRF